MEPMTGLIASSAAGTDVGMRTVLPGWVDPARRAVRQCRSTLGRERVRRSVGPVGSLGGGVTMRLSLRTRFARAALAVSLACCAARSPAHRRSGEAGPPGRHDP